MTRISALVLSALVIGVAIAAGQPPAMPTGIDQYRKHFLKSSDEEPKDGTVKVTYLGTTTLLFDDGETQIMIDGFFSRPSLLKAAGKIETDPKVVDAVLKKAKVERLKALFVAHSHYDHAFDAATVARKTKAKLYGSASTLNIGRGGDLKDDQMELYDPGKELKIGKFTVTVFKGKHSPAIKGINDDLGETIDKPLKQPATFKDYKEGGAFDFLIQRGDRTILVLPSSNYVEGTLDQIRADVLFLGTGSLGKQPRKFRGTYYDNTVKKVKPQLVIPIHWDNFFQPLSDQLEFPGPLVDNGPAAFDYLLDRLKTDRIPFGILQGYQSTVLFGKDWPPVTKDK